MAALSPDTASPSDAVAVLRWRRAHIPSNVGVSYASSVAGPLLLSAAAGCHLFDAAGRRYLDCVNNVAHVGHCHPTVVEAAVRQLSTLNTNSVRQSATPQQHTAQQQQHPARAQRARLQHSPRHHHRHQLTSCCATSLSAFHATLAACSVCQRYLSSTLCQYAAELLSTFPPSLCRVYFVNSGSEANDLALRLVSAASSASRQHILCLEAAYHGSTVSTVQCSPYKFQCQAGLPAASHIHVCKLPNSYLGVAADEAVRDVQQQIDGIESAGGSVLAFIHESSPSCAGQLLLPPGYLASVYAAVRAAGGLCIADEVQTGLGRNGST